MIGRTASGHHRTPLVPPGTRVYAIGDIHGRADLLDQLLDRICQDARLSRAGRRVLVFLGDYIDRGPASRQVIERVIAGPPSGPGWAGFHWVGLRGNHEDAMLRFLDDPRAGPVWLMNGGTAMIDSYAGGDAALDMDDMPRLQERLRRRLPEEHRAFLAGLPLSHVEGDYFFAHAGVRPGIPLDRQDPEDLMWIRQAFLGSSADFGKVVVHGHTITPVPEIRSNRIGIDTGAYRTGRLTALVLEGAERRFLEAR
jgi:serine/threonine protein phosphatase 1